MLDKIYIGAVVVLMLVLFYCLYLAWQSDTDILVQYDKKIELVEACKLSQDRARRKALLLDLEPEFKKHNISVADAQALNKLEYKIRNDEAHKHKSTFKKIANTCFYSIMQGGATGFITGGVAGSLGGAIVFGTVMPIVAAYRELYPSDETLVSKN